MTENKIINLNEKIEKKIKDVVLRDKILELQKEISQFIPMIQEADPGVDEASAIVRFFITKIGYLEINLMACFEQQTRQKEELHSLEKRFVGIAQRLHALELRR